MDRLSGNPWAGSVGKRHSGQIATQSTWGKVPDSEMTAASFHTIRCVPKGYSTVTYMNKLDPNSNGSIDGCYWNDPPGGYGEVNERDN